MPSLRRGTLTIRQETAAAPLARLEDMKFIFKIEQSNPFLYRTSARGIKRTCRSEGGWRPQRQASLRRRVPACRPGQRNGAVRLADHSLRLRLRPWIWSSYQAATGLLARLRIWGGRKVEKVIEKRILRFGSVLTRRKEPSRAAYRCKAEGLPQQGLCPRAW